VTHSRRVGGTLLAAVAVALVVLLPASARTDVASRYGGTLVVGQSRASEPDSLDPTVSRSGSSAEIFRAFCERLYDYDAKFRRVPVLAAAAPVLSKDKLSYTIRLRKGIQFNDGTPFNAQAVVASVQRFMSYPGSVQVDEYANVESVSASGPNTVVFRLKARDSAFPANPYVLSPTQLARVGDRFGADPVCVGPFMFDHRVPGDNVTVIKSPHYYGKSDVYLDKIVFKPIPDQTAAVAALKAGDVQALDWVPTTELDGVRRTPNLRVLESRQLGWSALFINIGNRNGAGNLPYANVGTPLASSAKLRQAFEEAIDRNALNRVLYDGLNEPACTLIAPANTAWYEATKVPCTPYDPKHARKLVAESGFSNPTVRLLVSTGGSFIRVAQFIQAQEAEVGIQVVIDATDSASSLRRAVDGNFDTYLFGLQTGVPDPHDTIYRFFVSSGLSNRSGYANPRLDFVLNNALKATDIKARSTLYRVAQQIIANDRPMFVLFNQTVRAACSTTLSGVRLATNGNMIFTNARFK
jgi:peptide/nickel transport system substrate-binding protein